MIKEIFSDEIGNATIIFGLEKKDIGNLIKGEIILMDGSEIAICTSDTLKQLEKELKRKGSNEI